MSAATATPKTWRVVINTTFWDLDRFMLEWSPGTIIHQSKGALPMVRVPARGDTVVYVSSMAIVMRGTVISDGFLEGTAHQEDPYIRVTTSGTRSYYTETPLYADIQIDNVYLDLPALRSGQATWALVSDKDHWSPTLAALATLTPPPPPSPVVDAPTVASLSAEVADLRIRLAAAEARHAETDAILARLRAALSSVA
jgi:hypothetical protein